MADIPNTESRVVAEIAAAMYLATLLAADNQKQMLTRFVDAYEVVRAAASGSFDEARSKLKETK